MFVIPPDGVQILLRPGAALRATLPEQRHEREEVRKRVEGRAVVHRIRSRSGTALDAGGSAGRRGAGGTLRSGSRRRGNSETGTAAFRYLFRLSQTAAQPYVERGIDRRRDDAVIEQRRDGATSAAAASAIATATTSTADCWRQG